MAKWIGFDKLSLKRELISLMLLCSSVALILSCCVTYLGGVYFIDQALSNAQNNITTKLADNTKGAIISSDLEKMRRSLEFLATYPEIKMACLYNATNEPIGNAFFRQGLPTDFHINLTECPPFSQGNETATFSDSQLHTFSSVKEQNIKIGGVYLRAEDTTRSKYVTKLRFVVGAKFLLITFIIYLLARYLQSTISKPLIELNDILSSIIQQRVYTSQFVFEREDEIGVLANKIKKLLQTLSKAHTDLRDTTYTDGVTNLPNRRFFLNDLKKHLSAMKRSKKPIAVIIIYVDGLDNVYQTLGEKVGDGAWTIVAKRLKTCIRSEQIVARLSDHCFATVQTNAAEAWRVRMFCNRIFSCFFEKIECENQSLSVSASIGIACATDHKQSPGNLIELSFKAMEKARKESANRLMFHEEAFQNETTQVQKATSEFSRLLQKDKIAIYTMPIFKLDTQRVNGLDLLPFVTPAGKAPFNYLNSVLKCEDKATIDAYHKWFFKALKDQLHHHGSSLYGEIDNITWQTSIKHIYSDSFVDTILNIGKLLDGYGIKFFVAIPEYEGLALDPMHKNLLGTELENSNVSFALDIAYNSALPMISEAHELPIKLLRFNLTNSNIDNPTNIDRLFNTITLKMAQLKGIHCLALHIGSPYQLKLFTNSRCAFGQGNHLSQPMPLEQLRSFLAHPPSLRA